ncbi:ArsR/SmtB family transcription factor [Azospirillum rugosum]|uniref:ArsR family transcriptional regulator n=1 Tax=Azospirillum rugosum TaxID=416170 RepID=A0ABS4SW20_9PROT|nr:metalloregulator ArsR/SmtB family transcription factor [Azospirillum rugosum]MBP2296762.1 ArsR family transcriptional regulator [Azospirillum rugosum]MDQ0530365.1 ArsR family transcriptional regulator [Azospirillum rugosum]
MQTEAVTSLMSVLSDPTRLGAVRLLWDGREHCVCELMDRLAATQSRMSRHMAALKSAGLVVDRRDAQWVRYRRNPALAPQIAAIIDAVIAAMAEERKEAA